MLDIIILTVRERNKDFRFPLFEELAALGHRVDYVFLNRRPQFTSTQVVGSQVMSLSAFLCYMAGMRRRGRKPVVLNSTNLVYPGLTTLLRLLAGGGWVLDMHDDLLYDSRGWRRLANRLRLRVLLANSDMIVHAAPTLVRQFPRSQHIGNGSSLKPLPKVDVDPKRVLVMSSFDGRFDVEFMRAAAQASPTYRFDLYGHVVAGSGIQPAFAELLRTCHNVRHLGSYSDPQLPELLAHYRLSFAPYKVRHHLTDYIDPLRFYHCLNSGVAVVSTAIPQALAMPDNIHVVRDPAEVPVALAWATVRPVTPVRNWRDVAKRLVTLVEANPAMNQRTSGATAVSPD
jgi:hypothetical protein